MKVAGLSGVEEGPINLFVTYLGVSDETGGRERGQ